MSAAHKFRECEYMPYRLKGVLVEHGITQPMLRAAVLQSNNQPLSSAALSLLINHRYYPRSTPAEWIRRQVEDYLRKRDIAEAEIATIWESPDGDGDQYRRIPARGARLNQEDTRKRKPHNPPLFDPMEVEMLSPKAKRHFKLFRDPFQDEMGGSDDVFLSDDQRYIGEAMFHTAKHGGFVAIVGESGSGKTTLRRTLEERIRDMPIRMIFPQTLDKSKLSTGNICQAIINDLAPGTRVRSSLEAQARQVREVLLASSRADFSHVLVIEEAHDLSIATLKYLKRFYELEDGFKKMLSIILIGQPELRRSLDERYHHEAREVIRRIEIAELLPLGQHLEAYIAHKFKRAQVDPAAIFAPDAYDAIRERWLRNDPQTREPVSNLYPLIVNNTATKAMNKAAELGAPLVTGDVVRRV